MSKKRRFRKFVQYLLKLFWASSTDSENITSSTYYTDSHKSDSYDQNILSDIIWKRQSLFLKLIRFHILLKISCTFFLCQNILTTILTKNSFSHFALLPPNSSCRVYNEQLNWVHCHCNLCEEDFLPLFRKFHFLSKRLNLRADHICSASTVLQNSGTKFSRYRRQRWKCEKFRWCRPWSLRQYAKGCIRRTMKNYLSLLSVL